MTKVGKRIIATVLVIMTLAVLVWVCIMIFAPDEWVYATQYREAQRIIDRIEQYKSDNGKYPPNLSALGIEEKDEGPYYTLQSEAHYAVHFAGGHSFFACQVYESDTRKWHEHD